MKKIISSVASFILLPVRWLKKSKIDNFVGGLIVGAIFSLVVNIATVKVQEDINRQRVLESLEREIVGHLLDNNRTMEDQISLEDGSSGLEITELQVHRRLSTRVWENSEVQKYIFELPTASAGEVEAYYENLIVPANDIRDKAEEEFKVAYKGCSYELGSQKDVDRPREECDAILLDLYIFHNAISEPIYESIVRISDVFHPTQDRIDSFWLRIFLGDNAHNIMRRDE